MIQISKEDGKISNIENENHRSSNSERARPEILEIAKRLYDKHSNLMKRLKNL
ncbi:hypothetical protein [Companilactobacillus suantsaicola]|uniref:hypothetical protein n=1 Tax=Companilactobacillus suantsaicola TaxID=2487723 RepID=UPI001436BDC5|nr:hypothetical protein [Companilactobacillus suantsaicola]